MTNLSGANHRNDLLLLAAVEAAACFAAVYLVLAAGLGGGALPPASAAAVAGAIALAAGLATGAIGRGLPFARARRLGAATLLPGVAFALLAGLAAGLLLPARSEAGLGLSLLQALLAAALALGLVRLAAGIAQFGIGLRPVAALGRAASTPLLERADDLRRDRYQVVLRAPDDAARMLALLPDSLGARRPWAVIADEAAAVPPALRRWCEETGVRLIDTQTFRELRSGRVDLDRPLGAAPAAPGALVAATRRAFDILCGLTLAVATLPVLVLTALAIKLDSRGPVFYRQSRVGLDGRPFTLFKFRSMVVDAEAGGAPRWASQADPRVTRVGRFIRLTRIDEVPQVINVLRGEMAFVGPRPERPAFVEQLARVIPHYDARAAVKPGITGWAQVNYPYGASVEDSRMKLTYDLYYVRHRTLLLDLQILLATVRVVLFRVGSR